MEESRLPRGFRGSLVSVGRGPKAQPESGSFAFRFLANSFAEVKMMITKQQRDIKKTGSTLFKPSVTRITNNDISCKN